jgi:hypothetical protein
MSCGLEVTCFLWLCTQDRVKSDQNLSALVGSDACRPELRGTGSTMNLALDRKQRAYLETRNLNRPHSCLSVMRTMAIIVEWSEMS